VARFVSHVCQHAAPVVLIKTCDSATENHATALCVGSFTNTFNQLAKKTFGATTPTNRD